MPAIIRTSSNSSYETKNGGTFTSYYSMGHVLLKRKDYEKAVWYYSKAIERAQNDPRVFVERGHCYLCIGKHQLALEDASTALKLNKRSRKAIELMGEIYIGSGEFEQALTVFYRGKKMYGNDECFNRQIRNLQEIIDRNTRKEESILLETIDENEMKNFYISVSPKLKNELLKQKFKKEKLEKLSTKNYNRNKKVDEPNTKFVMPSMPFSKNATMRLLDNEYKDRIYYENLGEIEDLRTNMFCKKPDKGSIDFGRNQRQGSNRIGLDLAEAAKVLDERTHFYHNMEPRKARGNRCIHNKIPYDLSSYDVIPSIKPNHLQ